MNYANVNKKTKTLSTKAWCQKIIRLLPLAVRKRLPRGVKIIEIPRKEAKRLNQKYRKKNRAANVLSFHYGSGYGEILVCPEVIRREAKEQGNTYKYQMTWMILHGMIHLAGMHHEGSRRGKIKFGNLERGVLHHLVDAKLIK